MKFFLYISLNTLVKETKNVSVMIGITYIHSIYSKLMMYEFPMMNIRCCKGLTFELKYSELEFLHTNSVRYFV